ncbi:hypothetical protein Ancab_028321 [Ancistrocladus abbreviatus]
MGILQKISSTFTTVGSSPEFGRPLWTKSTFPFLLRQERENEGSAFCACDFSRWGLGVRGYGRHFLRRVSVLFAHFSWELLQRIRNGKFRSLAIHLYD